MELALVGRLRMEDPVPVSLGCAHLHERRHICAFFGSGEEARRVLMPFITEGFAAGHKAVHILREDEIAQHVSTLEEEGVDVSTGLTTGQLELRRNVDTYLVDGQFDQERMLDSFETMAGGGPDRKFPLSRIVCNMDWVHEAEPDPEQLIEFEARVNHIWNSHPDVVICVYDARRMSGAMMIDIMRTHPMVLIGTALQQNPFYTPPEQFLAERRIAAA
ncbi:MEDS domain-containing protein [Sphingomonas daechungensis]